MRSHHWILLPRKFVLAAAAAIAVAVATWPLPARAQMAPGLVGPTADVCNSAAAAAAGRTAAAIVRTACQEHRQWYDAFIETDGRLLSLGVTEAERTRLADGSTPAWRQVVRYWRESGTLSSLAATPGASSCQYAYASRDADNDCRAFIVDNPWSAAFISWVMARSPLYGFGGSPRHIDYIARAWRDPQGSPYLYADPFSSRPAPGDLLCFLRSSDEGLGAEGLRQALGGGGRMPTQSHCEIVVAASFNGDGKLYLVGGNVLNSVVMRKLPLDRDGRLLASALRAPARAAPGTPVYAADDRGGQAAYAGAEDAARAAAYCRPGDPAACSFNHRDWAVLLRLKPQSQLGSYFRVASPATLPSPPTQAPGATAVAAPAAPAPPAAAPQVQVPSSAPATSPATTPATAWRAPAAAAPAPPPTATPAPAPAPTQPTGVPPEPPEDD
ncbi:DUF2272 domain-containing protein [Pseudoxanthomonas koreensis]|uniref:DUF2272 domain-containing protein n=1 Tax=Pseudoxanthomonas koreensis TaxID=266061 RepID=UPI001391B2E1|nr:DUF2272 domain-containing protein [Pseudoxanthomonas koreensis]